jgi:protein SDA1
MERDAMKLAGMKQRGAAATEDEDHESAVSVARLMSGIKKKDDKEARMASIKAGREGRKFGSKRGSDERTSLTNREKAKKNKAFMMIVHKRSVRCKAKASLRDKQRVLRKHITKQKKKGF